MPAALLSDIRVLDLSRLLPGPYCTLLLADLGAEVIKVETPGVGDYARLIPTDMGGDATFRAVNRNKQSLALNYRNARGLQVFLRLAREADVIVETFRPGAVDRWGMGYEAVRAVNPGIIYCSLSGYGQTGPYAYRAGHDLNYLAIGGLLGLNGTAGGPPIPPGVQIADLAGGMLATIAILGALLGRQRGGEGRFLDVAMLDAVVSWVAPLGGAEFLRTGRNPERGAMPLSGRIPCYNVYASADGRYLTVSALEPHFWTAFCEALKRPDWISRQFDSALVPELVSLFSTQARDAWLAQLVAADACVEPVNGVDEMMRDPQVQHRGLVVPSAASGGGAGTACEFASPFQFASDGQRLPPPGLGEHTQQVLQAAGFSEDEVRELAAAKIVRLGNRPSSLGLPG